MRISLALATAALALAAPAAAQPHAGQIMHDALEQAHRNVAPEVRDYTLTISSGPVRTRLYVYRVQDGWKISEEADAPLADLFESMLIGPALAGAYRPDGAAQLDAEVRYLGADSVDGRAAHVLAAQVPGLRLETMDLPDSAHVYVDAGTRQVLRVATSTDMEPSYSGAMVNGGHLDMVLTFGGYETIDGVTLPRRMHVQVRMQTRMGDEQRAAMRSEVSAMLQDAAADTSQEAAQIRLLTEMFLRMLDGEPMDIPAVVEEVQVNAGPPAWATVEEVDFVPPDDGP